MNEWLVAATVLLGLLVVCLAVCVAARAFDALVALEVSSSILAAVLLLLAEGFHRQPFVDLALIFAVLSFAGSLTFARLLERRL